LREGSKREGDSKIKIPPRLGDKGGSKQSINPNHVHKIAAPSSNPLYNDSIVKM
jgi:hypothetical protein